MSSAVLASWQNGHNNSLATTTLLIQREGTETHDGGQNCKECIWKIFIENKGKMHMQTHLFILYRTHKPKELVLM